GRRPRREPSHAGDVGPVRVWAPVGVAPAPPRLLRELVWVSIGPTRHRRQEVAAGVSLPQQLLITPSRLGLTLVRGAVTRRRCVPERRILATSTRPLSVFILAAGLSAVP